jgi:hypothetical protein
LTVLRLDRPDPYDLGLLRTTKSSSDNGSVDEDWSMFHTISSSDERSEVVERERDEWEVISWCRGGCLGLQGLEYKKTVRILKVMSRTTKAVQIKAEERRKGMRNFISGR